MIKNVFPLVYTKNINLALKYKAVLCLENSYFHIFKIKIENVINKEDRILKIEDHLEIIFPKYNSSDFILNYEFLEKEEEYENLVVYLLNLNTLKKENIIIDNNKYQIISIIPSFFKVCEFSNNSNFYNFDASNTTLVVSKYTNGKLEDINAFYMEAPFIINDNHNKASYSNIINAFLPNIEENYLIIFTGESINTEDLELENKTYRFFDIESIDFRKYPNFLPKKLQRKYILYSLNFKYLLSIFILTVISIFSSIFLHYKIKKAETELEHLETNSSLLEEENADIRKEFAEIEKEIVNLEKQRNKITESSFKISDFLDELRKLKSKNISISSIEYDGKKILTLIGSVENFSDLNLFLNNIQNSEKINLENYDYILRKDRLIEFQLELSFI